VYPTFFNPARRGLQLLVNEEQQVRIQSQLEAYTRRKLCRVPGHERFLPDGWSWRGKVAALSKMITLTLEGSCAVSQVTRGFFTKDGIGEGR
jgi:hypothetical protein